MATVSTVISRIRRRLEDPSALHWPDTEVIGSINEAKQDLYDHIFNRNRDVFNAWQRDYLWPSDTMSMPMEAVVPGVSVGGYDVILTSVTPTTDDVTRNNRPIPIARVNFEELYRHTAGTSPFYDDALAGNWDGGAPVRYTNLRWTQQGDSMYLDPIPSIETKMRFQIINRFREFNEDGTENALGLFSGDEALFRRWERLIEYMATIILKGRSDESEDPLLMQMQAKITLLNAWLDARSQGGTPRIVVDGY